MRRIIAVCFIFFLAIPGLVLSKSTEINQKKEENFSKVVSLAKLLFSNKILRGEDGIIQKYSMFKQIGSAQQIQVEVTLSDGLMLMVLDTLVLTPNGLILIEEAQGMPKLKYDVTLTSLGNFLVNSRDSASKFISRECRLVNGKTSCIKTIIGQNGSTTIIKYSQIKP
ncbi:MULTISPECIES: hypothetical protein [Legionella]|uniref:Uncharacterized protein n=1 Tax=Legionella drozanskii LLAP-1 TaxID=1212489 RepID=A0A0W0SMR0_9GAMM|nr:MULTISPECIES: hypothetical protein [Legionella]KTC84245.1 hypothetical protein Ldro_3051 [Legionella drozanskii LLAP-1]PJE07206.1 MAG: hypothetical protein CK430_14400 [Legionella sp.]